MSPCYYYETDEILLDTRTNYDYLIGILAQEVWTRKEFFLDCKKLNIIQKLKDLTDDIYKDIRLS